jgi:serine kinase of HPr protein (carbohydrate metabolism regulator)
MIRVHGTAIALGGEGILLRGPSGAGKSDFALRLIDQGARLVADDQTELRRNGDGISMSAPATIAGQMEVRGLGIVSVPSVASAPLRLVVDLVPSVEIERMPLPRQCSFLGCTVPAVALAPFEASAPAKLRLALRSLAQGAVSTIATAVPS